MELRDKYINPLTDFGFKRLFGTEPNKALLIDFLNQLLPSKHQIKELSYSKNEQMPESVVERKAIFDIFCESESGEKFIVEVQKAKQNFFKDRSVYYSTFPIREQAKTGNWNFKLSAVYTIGILDFIFDEHKNDWDIIHTVRLKDQNDEVFYDKLTFIYIELPKFTKAADELENRQEKWLYVFRHLADLQNRPQALQDRVFEKLFDAAEIAQFSPEEQKLYQESLKTYWDMQNIIDTAREEGREEGVEAGKLAERLEIAKGMKRKGIDVSLIQQVTGLSKDKIQKL